MTDLGQFNPFLSYFRALYVEVYDKLKKVRYCAQPACLYCQLNATRLTSIM